MTPRRIRLGAAAWVLTLQFFLVETIAQLRYDRTYSRLDDVISDLGAGSSPAHTLMNASFVLQGVLIAAGALLLGPVLSGGAARAARLLLGTAALGVAVVGLFPDGGNDVAHAVGAALYLLGGGLGLMALGQALRRRSTALAAALAVLGLVGVLATVLFGASVFGLLGEGGTERAAAYVVPMGLPLAGLALRRQARPNRQRDGALEVAAPRTTRPDR